MPKSQITAAIEDVTARGVHPVLKARGFKKRGRTFHRPAAEQAGGILYHAVHVLGSQHNAFDSGKFTLELMVTAPELVALWTGERVPQNPGSPRSKLLSQRIGHLMPVQRDTWWSIDPDSDLNALTREVGTALAFHGLPFFASPAFQSAPALLAALEEGALPFALFGSEGIRAEVYALLLYHAGRTDEAQGILAEQIAGAEGRRGLQGYVARLRALMARLEP